MPFIGNAGQASNIYEKNYATTTLRIVEGDAAYQSYNPADSHYKLITNLESITAVGSTSSNTVYLTNAHIGYTTVANVGIMNTSPIHTLDVGANVYIDEFGSNVVYVKGNIFSEKLQTTDIIADQEISCRDLTAFNVVRSDDTVTNQIFPRTATFLHITSNTGVLNSAPQHTLSVSDKLIIDKDGSNIVYVHGNTYSDHLKAPISTIENVFTNNVYAKSDNIVHIGSNVGIMNSNPIHTLDVGSNVQIDDVGSNTFWTGGNVYAQRYSGTEITLTGTIVASDFILSGGSQSTPTPQLQTISEVNPQIGQIQFSSDKTLTLTNVTKGLNVASNITTMTLYGNVVSENVYSTGNITVGTNNLFVDTTVGRVGINKSSPVKELDVAGEIAGSGDLAIGTNKLFVDVSEGHVGINKSSPTKALDVVGKIACSSNLEVNTNKLFVDANAGRVGINKSSPTEALDVVGKISGTDDLAIGTNKLFVDVSESRVGINKSSPTEALDVVGKISGTDDLAIGTNKLFVDVSEGRVGINKSSPTKALDVTGEIAGSDDLTIGTNKLFVDVSTGRVGINKSSPTKALDVTGEIACSSDFAVATNKLFVNTSTGRIGINRNDPGKNLDIAGDFRCSSDLQVGSVANLFVDVSESCVGINKSTPSRALDVVGKIAGTDDLVIGTDKLFVDVSTGRVGINKSAPTKALDVVGKIAGTDDLEIGTDKLFVDVSTSRVGINKSAPTKALDVVGEIQASSHATIGGNLTVNTDDLVVDTVNSRVGINKSAPSKALDVVGEIQASSHATIGGNLTVNTDDLVVDTVNSRVGINKSAPSKALDVVGDITCSGDLTATRVSGNGSGLTSLDAANITTGTLTRPTSGNAATATALQTARTINGINFNGTGNITITANTPNTLSRGSYLTGSNFNGSVATTWAVDATEAATGGKIVARDANGDIFGRYVTMSHTTGTRSSDTIFYSSTDDYIRKTDAIGMRASLNVPTRTGDDATGTWGINITGTAGTATVQSGGTVTCTSGTFSETFSGSNASSRDKFRVYPSSSYSIGMQSDVTYGDLNDWAMTFQMNNDDDRGFWWGDDGHGVNQGAMALSTRGWLNVAERIKVGGGQTDTDAASKALHVVGESYFTGNVGINQTSPTAKLHIKPNHSSYTTPDNPAGAAGVTVYNETNSGPSISHSIISLRTAGAAGGDPFISFDIASERGWTIGIDNDVGSQIRFSQRWDNLSDTRAYISVNSSAGEVDFTGQHRSFVSDVPHTEYLNLEGLIVSANKNQYFDIQEEIVTGVQAIKINESLPLVSISNVAYDKCCFGVISGSEVTNDREYSQGSFVSVLKKQEGDIRAHINSVGEGAIWVTNINGPLESGDYITTSNVAGYGQKQDSEFLANYTVAKITMDCDFEPATQPVRIIKKELQDVNYWVKYTYDDISEEEYTRVKNLGRRVRVIEGGTEISQEEYDNHIKKGGYTITESNTYIRNDTTYQRVFSDKVKEPKEGYELEVRNEPVNVLDEHGQLQWEDDPSGATEKAYKIRYLDADGNITDEANAVHIAAFVGCTYHCG